MLQSDVIESKRSGTKIKIQGDDESAKERLWFMMAGDVAPRDA